MDTQARVNFAVTQDQQLHELVENFWRTESFGVLNDSKTPLSIQDKEAQQMLEKSTSLIDGHYQVGMLWKRENSTLPNNIAVATRRYKSMARRLSFDEQFSQSYCETMNGYIAKSHALKLSPDELQTVSPRIWYLPHHGVVNINKPGKVRVVFDAAAQYSHTSLNDNLITGPDLLNNLFGVLQRFRLFETAITADIEGMFHQVHVSPSDSDSLRFLWKADVDKPGPPDSYKMTVHVFGAVDSPTCANYAVKRTALDKADNFSETAVESVLHNCYVDDLLNSVECEQDAVKLSDELIKLLQKGGFRLHKWMSNSCKVLDSIPESERAVNAKDLDLDEIPVQRALGLKWIVNEDCFVFEPTNKGAPFTKRGVVSVVSSVFDPCGFLAPFIFRAKCIVQELWEQKLDWDEPLTAHLEEKWKRWLSELDTLCTFKLPRHHLNFSSHCDDVQMHIFGDASEKGFGAVAYLHYVPDKQNIVCSLLAAKSRVAPLKPTLSIPRLELQGAVLSVRMCNALKNELILPFKSTVFWTDSNIVLQYINNETRRFKPFVSNRVSEIIKSSDPKQWRHVPSAQNPADHCTRGLSGSDLSVKHTWVNGPQFLHKGEDFWRVLESPGDISENDSEVKQRSVLTATTCASDTSLSDLKLGSLIDAGTFSTWRRLCRHTAWVTRAVRNFLSVLKHRNYKPVKETSLLVSEYKEAELHAVGAGMSV